MSWLSFAAIFGLFLVIHSLPVRPKIKSRLVKIFGPRGFILAYSILSIAMLTWLIAAAGNAPYVELWDQALWHRYATFGGMLLICLLLALTIGRPNPFSFGGVDNERFNPDRPGLIRCIRHPILIGLSGWSALHILPNGDLAHVILFGALAGFALVGMKIIDRRKQRILGEVKWMKLRHKVASAPMFSMHGSWFEVLLRIAICVLGFTLLLALHLILIGVSPLF